MQDDASELAPRQARWPRFAGFRSKRSTRPSLCTDLTHIDRKTSVNAHPYPAAANSISAVQVRAPMEVKCADQRVGCIAFTPRLSSVRTRPGPLLSRPDRKAACRRGRTPAGSRHAGRRRWQAGHGRRLLASPLTTSEDLAGEVVEEGMPRASDDGIPVCGAKVPRVGMPGDPAEDCRVPFRSWGGSVPNQRPVGPAPGSRRSISGSVSGAD